MVKWKCCGGGKGEEEVRQVYVNEDSDAHKGYKDNYTSTTKYNIITFFPKALFEQYRRVANIYFTLMAALSLTPYSSVRPWTTWLPLGIVLGVSIIKEAFEDYRRYKQDKEVNNRMVERVNPTTGQYEHVRWRDLKVGDVVVVNQDEFFPADLFFLSAENEEGTCYIETMNLDGETNLKIKKSPDETKGYLREHLSGLKARIECEGPNSRLYQFVGNVMFDHPHGGATEVLKLPISPAAILLRGCSLRNTPRVFGAVIYAGHETKVFMNATDPPSKRSRIERRVDIIIAFMFIVLLGFCISNAIYFSTWTANKMPDAWYLAPYDTPVQYNPQKRTAVGAAQFITAFVLYSYLIPISLYVSIEMVKLVQARLIGMDREMYYPELDKPASARTSNLNEELGMVNTILTDKTGTLTRNVMEFFKCSIGGVSYGAGVTEIERSNAARKGQSLPEGEDPNTARYKEQYFNFYDSKLMDGAWTKQQNPELIEMFFRLLAVCHTVIPDGPQDPKEIKYEAESPDEAALVVGAKVMGFFFYRRTNTAVYVRETTAVGQRDMQYEVLNVLEFNSTRKRMSVVVKDSTGKLLLFCKGADTVIYERLDHRDPLNQQLKEPTSRHMEHFGSAGLRTLCLSYKEIDPAFYEDWQQKFVAAKTSLQDRDTKVAEVSELIENNLRLLGCTAIEDKLQEGVPRTIKLLAEAGIRIWVLTGDKMETAINIGYSCNLINEDMQMFQLTAYFPDVDALEAEGRMDEAAKIANERVAEQLSQAQAEMVAATANSNGEMQFTMVIDGKALSYALSDRLRQQFLQVGLACAAVICCRVSPLQKAQVTALVKGHGDTTLAIGDGANDVGMIQQAHIGVGISGQEGMQAVMSADFAIAQFRFLLPLLLVHGRWSYKRIARMICFFFFKNMMFGITIFVGNAFTTFSGQYIYNDFYMTLFNVVFTSLTPIIIGIFDRDVDRAMGMKYPALYKQGQRNTYFNLPTIAGWILNSAWCAAVICTLVLVGNQPTMIDRSGGNPNTMYATGCLMFSIVIVVVHLEVVIVMEQWTWLHHFSIWVSQLVWWLFLLIFGAFPYKWSLDLYMLFVNVVAPSPQYWLYLLVVPLACEMPSFFFRHAKRYLYPEDHQIVQEIQLQMKRKGGLAEPDPGNIVLRIFDKPMGQQKNTGFVPPYDSRSRFYTFITSAMKRGNNSQLKTSARSPVLTHLDKELTNNPYRGSNRYSGTSLPPLTPPVPESQPGIYPGQLVTPTAASTAIHTNGLSTPNGVGNGQPAMSQQEKQQIDEYRSALER